MDPLEEKYGFAQTSVNGNILDNSSGLAKSFSTHMSSNGYKPYIPARSGSDITKSIDTYLKKTDIGNGSTLLKDYSTGTPTVDTSWWDNLKSMFDTKGNDVTKRTVDANGNVTTTTEPGSFFNSNAAKSLQGLYGIGMDAYGIYSAQKNYGLAKATLEARKKVNDQNYGLAKATFNNNVADRQARYDAAKQSGMAVLDKKAYATV